MSVRHNVHATGLVLGTTGLMLRGPSGSGKSSLALLLLDDWEARGLPAKLVADDRLDLSVEPFGLVMHAPKPIEGLIELRGRGIVTRSFVRTAPLHLVVDFVSKVDRMVEEADLSLELYGQTLARCPVPKAGMGDSLHRLLLVREAIRALTPPQQEMT